MKPNFALNFTHDSIGLLHRTARGWLEIGATDLDAPDLGEALNYLRRSALGLAPHGVATKLVIPNSEILYLDLDAPGPDDTHRREQIRRALEGRTPYAVEDLVFDWSGDGPTVKVAVVARETLVEAEQFATQHRFNPVSFVAIPEVDAFDGEPWFGPSHAAQQLLSPGETVERDAEPIAIVAREMPRGEMAKPAAELSEPAAFASDAHEVPDESASPAQPELPQTEPVGEAADQLVPEAEAEAPPQPEPEAKAPQAQVAPELPVAATPSVIAPELPLDLPLEAPSFASRRVVEPAEPATPAAMAQPTTPIDESTADTPPAPAPQADDLPPPPPAAIQGARLATQKATPAKAGKPGLAAPARANGPTTGGMVTAPGIPGLGARRAKPASPPKPEPAAKAAAPGFAPRAMPKRGKPKYLGLILTGLLLLALAVIAALSSYYIASSRSDDTVTVAQADANVDDIDLPSVEDEAAADGIDLPALTIAEEPAPEPAEDQAQAEVTPPATDATAAMQPDAEAEPGATAPIAGSNAVDAPALTDGAVDEIALSTMDAPPAEPDTLPQPEAGASPDAPPIAQLPPPPFGTLYQFDENGMIRPTPEGIITPDGVRLVAGPPPVTPPARPASIAALAQQQAVAEEPAADAAPEAAATEAEPEAIISDPALAGFRPRARPEGLVVPESEAPVATETAPDDAALAIPEASRMTSIIPRSRPSSISALAEEARIAAQSASLSASADAVVAALAAEPEAAPAAPVSKLAVAISRRPPARPKDFSKAVEAAVAMAVRKPDPAPQPTAQRNEPEADDEPEIAVTQMPQIPTKVSVAQNATFVNAINLSRTNLIGVYGPTSKRYALIRLSSGQYKKVGVGDKVDGGVVAAITESELRYQKGGKMLALTMPKS